MNLRADWLIRIYDKNDNIIKQWRVNDRTEREAEKESFLEINNTYNILGGEDWSMRKITEEESVKLKKNFDDTSFVINLIRSEAKQEYGQTILDNQNDEELINFALNFLYSNLNEEILVREEE